MSDYASITESAYRARNLRFLFFHHSRNRLPLVASLSELPFALRLFLRTYRWRQIDPVPYAPLGRPLGSARIAVVTTAGVTLPDQPPFDERVQGGDWSFREIPDSASVASLRDSHRSRSFDHSGVQADPNLALPLDRLRELQAEGFIGELSPRHFSFMGSLTAPGRMLARSVPQVVDSLVADGVDAVLLVPI